VSVGPFERRCACGAPVAFVERERATFGLVEQAVCLGSCGLVESWLVVDGRGSTVFVADARLGPRLRRASAYQAFAGRRVGEAL